MRVELTISLVLQALQYNSDISHFSVSSNQAAACSVTPGTAEDVGKIVSSTPFMRSDPIASCSPLLQLQILGATKTPFAVSSFPLYLHVFS